MPDRRKLIEIRKSARMSQSDFAHKIGYSREVVSKVENGKMQPSKWYIDAVLKYWNDTQPQPGKPFVNNLDEISQSSPAGSSSYLQWRRQQKNTGHDLMVPLVAVKAQAGYAKGYEQTDFMDSLDCYALPPGVNPKGLEWSYFEVDGDSMEPSLSAGDMLLTSLLPQEDWPDIKNACVYVIVTGEQVLVKRVVRKHAGEWTLVSDNSQYPPVSIQPMNVKQVWTLRRHIRSKVPPPEGVV